MISYNAFIELYSGKGKRSTPISTGYRPLFGISCAARVSGSIILPEEVIIRPGCGAFGIVTFINSELIGEIQSDFNIEFFEMNVPLGKISNLTRVK